MDSFIAENDYRQTAYPPAQEIFFPGQGIEKISSLKTADAFIDPAIYFPLKNNLNRFFKRATDLVIACILVPAVLSWLIPLLAILIKLSSRGPVFFLQKRTGFNGLPFTCIKFRTMQVNAEADTMTARENDSRITRTGKILRKYHIDELPQLLNIIAGDMSLIGPRPYMLAEDHYYESLLDQYRLRQMVKPGITGLAQSYGHFGSVENTEKAKERFELDLKYLYHWSFWMDLKILTRTILFAAGKKSAYKASTALK